MSQEEVEATAYRLLARRGHGREELARKLRKRDHDEGVIEAVLEELERLGYIDDERFAEEQSKILVRKGWGPKQIEAKLRRRGVADQALQAAMEDLQGSVDWLDLARGRLMSRFGAPDGLTQKEKEKAFRHLRYRGFSPHLIRRLLFDGG